MPLVVRAAGFSNNHTEEANGGLDCTIEFLGGGATVIFLEVQGLHSLLKPYYDFNSAVFGRA